MTDKLISDITKGSYLGDKIIYGGITHYKYEDCAESDLVTTDNGIRVHRDVEGSFVKMQEKAKGEGIDIFILSGFRSVEYQKEIFPMKFIDKGNPTEDEFVARLKFSAPPGYSEHHTGYAIDINSVEDDFADTEEFQWLLKNAPSFGFEMSFPKDNKQNLGFEPWHWRYVVTADAKRVFLNARA